MRPWQARAAVSAGLSALFLAVYGAGQWAAAHRTGVPTFRFAWERRVPFVAAAIVPYLSIDLFFVTAPFLVPAGRELWAYAYRVATALGVAGVVFVLAPLRCGFDRPAVDGWVGQVFAWFQRADPPFNQLPSLHVALLLIVGDVFVGRAGGWTRRSLLVWFGLILASPLLVYQHQFADLMAGLALGLLCLHLFPDVERQAFDRNPRVGWYYAIGGGLLLAGCVGLGRWGWPLWWPTVSVLTVAAGYAGLGPSLYLKRHGRLGWPTRLLLGPTLVGQRSSLHWYARQCRPYDAVTDRLWIGRRLSAREAAAARAAGVAAVVDLTCEFTEPAVFRSLAYLHLPTLDLTAPTPEQVDTAVAFINRHAGRTVVYVHCKAGYSRTAVVAAAYLLATGRATSADGAIGMLRQARPTLVVRPEARRAIEAYARRIV